MKDAKGHGSNARGIVGTFTPDAKHMYNHLRNSGVPHRLAVDRTFTAFPGKTQMTNADAAAALASGPKSAPAPVHDAWSNTPGGDRTDWRLNSHTHEIVSPSGDVAARMRLGKNNGLAVDVPGQGKISHSGGPSIHDAVAMPDYRAKGGSFPADHISGALHFLTGKDFSGHTVRRVK